MRLKTLLQRLQKNARLLALQTRHVSFQLLDLLRIAHDASSQFLHFIGGCTLAVHRVAQCDFCGAQRFARLDQRHVGLVTQAAFNFALSVTCVPLFNAQLQRLNVRLHMPGFSGHELGNLCQFNTDLLRAF